MKNQKTLLLMLIIPLLISSVLAQEKNKDEISFTPIRHATFIIHSTDATIYVDPVGDIKTYDKFPKPDLILITDVHGDHLKKEVVNAVKQKSTTVVAPKAVVERLEFGEALNNGETKKVGSVNIEAIPMYNLTKERLRYHTKGRGNGYVVTVNKKRIYISGDTEDIPEMRNLKNIDYAFVCMNLPYTMTVEQAASAVLEFKPKVAIPYHYRGSDVEKFKQLVSKDKKIEVRLMEWYE